MEPSDTNKLTVSVGIPAHNEAKNIAHLLESVFRQKCLSFELERIYVFCDGCTDSTAEVVTSFQKKHQIISLKDDKQRFGKTARLNELYEANDSDYLFTLDGDTVLGTDMEIEKVLKVALETKVDVVAAHQIPLQVRGFVKKILYANHCLWTEIRVHINGGDYIQNLQGSATLISRQFAKQLVYPINIPCDQSYLYIIANRKNTFAFSPKNKVIYYPLGTIGDWNRLNRRISSEHHWLIKLFGENISQLYAPPLKYRLRGMLTQIRKDPFFTILAIGISYIFKFIIPFQKPDVTGIWPTLNSTKSAIEFPDFKQINEQS